MTGDKLPAMMAAKDENRQMKKTPSQIAKTVSPNIHENIKSMPAPGGNTLLADVTKNPLPPQDYKTIGDVLSAKGEDWVWYAGAWNEALQNRGVMAA